MYGLRFAANIIDLGAVLNTFPSCFDSVTKAFGKKKTSCMGVNQQGDFKGKGTEIRGASKMSVVHTISHVCGWQNKAKGKA